MALSRYPYKHHAVYLRSQEKSLRRSRRLTQSAKKRVRQPFHNARFERPEKDLRMSRPISVPFEHLGKFHPSGEDGIPVTFPETLERPELPAVTSAGISRFEPELANVLPEYAREGLAYLGMRAMGVVEKYRLHSVRSLIPGQLKLVFTDAGLACLPTHGLVIYPSSNHFAAAPPKGEPTWMNLPHSRDVIVVPIHAAILAANCGRLPRVWYHSDPQPRRLNIISESGMNEYKIPLVPFCLPYPPAFEVLVRYMYNRNTDMLLKSLVQMYEPVPVTATTGLEKSVVLRKDIPRERRIYYAASECMALYDTHLPFIHAQMKFVEGFWKNAIALAVEDDELWDVLQLSWQALVQAMKWTRGIRAQIAEQDAEMAAAAAREGRPSVVDPAERSSRIVRVVDEYVAERTK